MKRFHVVRLFLVIGIIGFGFVSELFAQIHPDSIDLIFPIENSYDPTSNTPQSFDLGDPSNVEKTIVYDPKTGKYVFREKMGSDLNYRNPSMMTLEEYIEYERQREMSEYWREKIDDQTEEGQPLIPPIKIESKAFANIFGSDEINIRPTGAVELSFGVNSSRYDNPILPERQRKIVRFDFQQKIQLNLVGQIGTRIKLNTSYNTQAQFDFDNITKLEYSGDEDMILQKIEAGNVSMPLSTTLIQGSQTLFGVRTKMRFGRLTVDAIASSSRGQKQTIDIEGGAQIQDFELQADNYEANRHYFLNYYHRENYDNALSTVPIVSSLTNITRIEVWLTNRQNNVEDTRNIIAFSDLGESNSTNWEGNPGNASSSPLPDNEANGLYTWASGNNQVRSFNNAVTALGSQATAPGPFRQAVEYEKVENARRLTEQEFSYNAQLGYISLNLPLNNDEVLAVAYEYTYRGQTFQVGEFSNDGVVGQEALFLKLLKPTITSPRNKVWDLMMKNVYSIGAYQVSQEGFRLNIFYNNPENSLPINFLPQIDDKQIVDLVEMDRLNQNNRPQQDGVFDFVPIQFNGNQAMNGGTINTRNGRIYFSTVEPFGATLQKALQAASIPQITIDNVIFQELYDSTKIAAQQIPSKNRFLFKGQYSSSVTSDIPLNALNVPEGAVTVTAGGIRLTEGLDYTVDYNLGRVKILNTGILESNTPIKIDIESQSVFGFQAKSLLGAHANYMINPDFNVGATWMMMTERPITQKVDIGDEPYRNNKIGMDIAYRKDLPILTKLVDLLPVISTKAKSSLTFNAEAAHLIPGTPRAVTRAGISYIDDFEGSQSTIDLKNLASWKLASIPQGQNDLFPESQLNNNLASGFNRGKLAWYVIDPLFYQSNALTPDNIASDPELVENNMVAQVNQTDLFPNLNPQLGQIANIPILDLAYYPQERGMYNYDTTSQVDAQGNFTNPSKNWAGIMRSLTTNDFEQTNVEYIQFWMADPFSADAEAVNPSTVHAGGDLYFNLGNVSEDILPDSRKSFENGLPGVAGAGLENLDTTNWAKISTQQVVVNAFDNDPSARVLQDVGLDGWNDDQERVAYSNYVNWIQNNSVMSAAAKARLLSDVSGDNFNYFRDDDYDDQGFDILQRYKRYNGHEGNSPTSEMSDTMNADSYPTQATNAPDIEDINRDNNLGQSEAYFQYKVSLRKSDLVVGKNYIINDREYTDGNKVRKWYQFRIPIRNPDNVINGITDFRSIRFMRMFLKDFEEQTVIRFAKLELVRGEWRRYLEDLAQAGDGFPNEPGIDDFNIGAVNIEQHDQRFPIPYKTPPGILREIDPSQTFQRQLNEQALTLETCGLEDGDARAAYRNVDFDVRFYKKLQMFVHAESQVGEIPINDDDLTIFVRLGTDFVENYYEYEMPMKVTAFNTSATAEQIWPEANNVEIVFDDLINVKKQRNNAADTPGSTVATNTEFVITDPKNPSRRLKVKGNPNLQGLRTLMIGVRNPSKNEINVWKPDDGLAKCAEIWVNELRLTDFENSGGSAALARANVQLADFANVNVAGTYSGTNWGAIDSRVAERQRDTRYTFDLSTNAQLGQFLGKKAGIAIPFFYSYSLGIINPEFDPFNPDIQLSDYDAAERRERAKLGQDYTMNRSFNFTNVRKEKAAGKKSHIWDVENFSLSYSQSERLLRDFNTEFDRTKIYRGGLNYNFSASPKLLEPFKKVKFMKKSKWWSLIRDANLYLGPKNISLNNDIMRSYNERKIRNTLGTAFEFQPIYLKNFTWDRTYKMNYDITKNLKFDISASNNAIFDEPEGQVSRTQAPVLYQQFRDSIRSQMNTLGKTMRYQHQYNFNYNVPFNKIPALDWVNANAKYSGGYEWQRSNLGLESFGNVIQNSRNINVTSQLNFTNLYNKVEFFKKINNNGRGGRASVRRSSSGVDPRKNPTKGAEPERDPEDMTEKEKEKAKRKKEREKKREEAEKKRGGKVHPVAGFLGRTLMTVRTVSGTYTINDGTLLPGYARDTRILGFSENGFERQMAGFIFGKQQRSVFGLDNGYEIGRTFANNGWMVRNDSLNTQHTVTHSQNITGRASLEPLKDVKIDLTMSRNFTENESSFFRYTLNDQYEYESKFKTQSVTYTTISIASAFEGLDKEYRSQSFDKLRANRVAVSELIGSANPASSLTSSGFYDGYDGSQQDVLIGAFLTSYSNRSIDEDNINPIKNIPLPNWTISYNGLAKYKFMKKYVRNFTLRHGYSSNVNVSGIQTNLEWQEGGDVRNINGNFLSEFQVQNVTISESFSPLIGFDATWKVKGNGLITRFEIKRDKSSSLALTNNQITETRSSELVIGTGYKFTKVKLPFKFGGKALPANDLNLRFDFSIRDNLTVIRKIVENTNQATAGQKVVKITFNADYQLGKNLTATLYYDQTITDPKIATSYPTGNMATGIRLRFNLGGL